MAAENLVVPLAVIGLIFLFVLRHTVIKTWQATPYAKNDELERLIFNPGELIYFLYKVVVNFIRDASQMFYFIR